MTDTIIIQAIQMLEGEELSHWSDAHDKVVIAVLKAALAAPQPMVTPYISQAHFDKAFPPEPQPVKQADDWEIRGQLTALKCWHRLTEAEADDLVSFFSAQPVKQAPPKSFKELEYKVGWQRYEKVRRLNTHQFSELFQRGLKGERFDEMVDQLESKP